MTDVITSQQFHHLNGDDTREEVMRWSMDERERISDGAAMTIASWWQSPGKGTHGAVMAQFASTGSVEREELIAAAEYERGFATAGQDDSALCALIEWARAAGTA